jgi:flagellar protein FliO/FliZ
LNFLGYFLNMIVMLGLVLGLAVGSLWLWRRFQPGMSVGGARNRAIRVIDAQPLGATGRLAVVEFADKRILLAISRGRIEKIAEVQSPTFVVPDED